MQIVWHLDQRHAERPLYPGDPARREEMLVFIDWFNLVWKGPPNAIEAELGKPAPDAAEIERLSGRWPRRSTASRRCCPAATT